MHGNILLGIAGIPDHKSKVCKYIQHRQRCWPDGPLLNEAAITRFGEFDSNARRTALKKVQNPAKVLVTARRTGLGSMSTQRRANRTTPAIDNDRAAVWFRWFRGCGGRTGISIPETRTGSILASLKTAPLMSIVWLAWAWLHSCDERSQTSTFRVTTNSLPSDTCFKTFAGLESLSGSPPREGAGERGLSIPQATRRSSLPHILIISVRARLHRPLPQAPAGRVRWAERHDGKRDLYFQHAA